MGISERKEREKTEMRSLILQSATELFVERGFEDTSIRTIAEKIEYSPATIYLYFKDKNELFHAIMDLAFNSMLEQFALVTPIKDPLERLRALGTEYMNFAFSHPQLYDLMFIIRKPMDHIQEASEWDCGLKSYNFLRDVLAECISENRIHFTNPDLASITVWSHLHGLIALSVRGRLIMIPEAIIPSLIHQSVDSMLEFISKKH